MILTVITTMLAKNLEFTVHSDEDAEDIASKIDEIRSAIETHGFTAEWRTTLDTSDDDLAWLYDQIKPRVSIPQLIEILVHANEEGWDDDHCVMAAFYAVYLSDKDNIIGAVDAEDWRIVCDEEEDEAYADFAKEELDDEISISGYEDYFDFERYGRDKADGCIRFHDGDYYVFREWN